MSELTALCKRHHYQGTALTINCHECRAEAQADMISEMEGDTNEA